MAKSKHYRKGRKLSKTVKRNGGSPEKSNCWRWIDGLLKNMCPKQKRSPKMTSTSSAFFPNTSAQNHRSERTRSHIPPEDRY